MPDTSTIPLISRTNCFKDRVAVIDNEGEFTYKTLLDLSRRVALNLLNGLSDLKGARVAFMCPPSFQYVVIQWAIWRAGGVAVPLALTHPEPELKYVLSDADVSIVVGHPKFESILRHLSISPGIQFYLIDEVLIDANGHLPEVDSYRASMILYTSGTTSKPKGVVLTHANIEAQVTNLVSAWGWTNSDRILNALPLHHVHGIVNALTCAFWVGAVCELIPSFDAHDVWKSFIHGKSTLFMGVPAMYGRLLDVWENSSIDQQRSMSDGCLNLRLMVSGSDALPETTFQKWKLISGHDLLERYGMTEIGMALSNTLVGDRVPGYVGTPLPNVEIRLVKIEIDQDEGEYKNNTLVLPGESGEIQVRGPSVFKKYWGKPEVTRNSFTIDKWFKTGDVASLENGMYRIWGRSSQDIFKTGGEKVSANEIQRELYLHPDIKECSVFGVPDPMWGDAVSVAIVIKEGSKLNRESLRKWASKRLANYKVPKNVIVLSDLPRNAMGKVVKSQLVKIFESEYVEE